MILGLFPELMALGGVQRLCQHTAAVLTVFAEAQGARSCLLSLNDNPGLQEMQVDGRRFCIHGFGQNKKLFFFAALRAGIRAQLIYLGHPFIAPIGAILHLVQPKTRYYIATYGIDVWERLPFPARWGLRQADVVTAISQYTAMRLIDTQLLQASKVTVLPPALDPSFWVDCETAIHNPLPAPQDKIILTVTRLDTAEHYKGVDTMLQAMPTVLASEPNVCYVVVGDGDDRPRLEALSRDIGISDHVVFAGIQPEPELRRHYAACDVFVLPSRGEGFGIVFLEAMAYRKPVIGGNHGGTPDVIVPEETGFLVQHGDISTLSAHVLAVLRDPTLGRRMGEAGRQRVEKFYTFSCFQEKLMNLLGQSESS